MALLTVKDLSCGYDQKPVVENLNFTVNEGDYLCIIGDNGSGKTTLLKTLLHLMKPISGQIITGDGLMMNEIGYLPQQTLVQKDFPASVMEIVLSGCQSKIGKKPFYGKGEYKLAADNMERMGILELKDRSYRELSGGQQQRVLLSRALCATGKLLILDEPVSALDPTATEEMYALIKKLNEDGITVIMISHDVRSALKYATHILHIADSAFFGTKEEFYKEDGLI